MTSNWVAIIINNNNSIEWPNLNNSLLFWAQQTLFDLKSYLFPLFY
jgi:hypothetical protein